MIFSNLLFPVVLLLGSVGLFHVSNAWQPCLPPKRGLRGERERERAAAAKSVNRLELRVVVCRYLAPFRPVRTSPPCPPPRLPSPTIIRQPHSKPRWPPCSTRIRCLPGCSGGWWRRRRRRREKGGRRWRRGGRTGRRTHRSWKHQSPSYKSSLLVLIPGKFLPKTALPKGLSLAAGRPSSAALPRPPPPSSTWRTTRKSSTGRKRRGRRGESPIAVDTDTMTSKRQQFDHGQVIIVCSNFYVYVVLHMYNVS